MLTILLEPANPNSDLYSITCVSDAKPGKMDVEVVGPGFDTSDILRSDITPHERFEIAFEATSQMSGDRRKHRIHRTYVVDADKYVASVQQRLTKIAARLKNPAFPDEVLRARESLAKRATQYLVQSHQTTLLDHADCYIPIPTGLLERFVEQAIRLSRSVAQSSIPWRTISLAASFVSRDRLVIWDFFPSEGYDTTSLSHLIGDTGQAE